MRRLRKALTGIFTTETFEKEFDVSSVFIPKTFVKTFIIIDGKWSYYGNAFDNW